MIEFKNINKSEPYLKFIEFYNKAYSSGQQSIEAISISTYDALAGEVNSRFVNLKYIINEDWIFFSNYESPKAYEINSHDQIAALFYWSKVDVQIRIKAKVTKSNNKISDEHYTKRSFEKNALAFSSNQSQEIGTYEEVLDKYKNVLKDQSVYKERPKYWGGFSFKPYSFEFWQGHKSRLNKRDLYKIVNGEWHHKVLQP